MQLPRRRARLLWNTPRKARLLPYQFYCCFSSSFRIPSSSFYRSVKGTSQLEEALSTLGTHFGGGGGHQSSPPVRYGNLVPTRYTPYTSASPASLPHQLPMEKTLHGCCGIQVLPWVPGWHFRVSSSQASSFLI